MYIQQLSKNIQQLDNCLDSFYKLLTTNYTQVMFLNVCFGTERVELFFLLQLSKNIQQLEETLQVVKSQRKEVVQDVERFLWSSLHSKYCNRAKTQNIVLFQVYCQVIHLIRVC